MGKFDLEAFARSISDERISLLWHQPEEGMRELQCFANVRLKIARHGGMARYGWIFQHKRVRDALDLEYLVATHHAVWNSPDGRVIDVTPFLDGVESHPLKSEESPLFLLDPQAEPLLIKGSPITFPLKFYPLGEDERLLAHVRNLRREEYRRMNLIREAAANAPDGSTIDTEGNIIPN